LHRFQFYDSTAREPHLAAMVDHIVKEWRLGEHNTQFVATTLNDEADSAQGILQELKPRFAHRGWQQVRTVNKLGGASKNIPPFSNVVLVDEFSGTGKTIKSRVTQLRSDVREALKVKGASAELTVRVCLLASMEEAIEAITAHGVQVFAPIVLKKGISGYYSGDALASARTQMERLESRLSPEIEGEPLPLFGYGRAEALFSTDENPPNSIFPVFWWPRSKSGKSRKTLLVRQQSYGRKKTD
jgi:hypothetical protein